MLAEQQGLAAITAERRYTYRIWRVVSVAWGKGATLQSLELRDSTLTIRVSAPVATDVLAAVAAIPGFTDAKLASPVRRGEFDREDFTLALTLLPVTDRG
jgi:hypothetical protein